MPKIKVDQQIAKNKAGGKTDYLKKFPKKLKKFQMGGPMPEVPASPEGAAPAPEGQGAPAQGGAPDLEKMITQAYQTQDPKLALEVVNMIAQESGIANGGGQPAPAPAPDQVPMGAYGMKVPKVSADLLTK